MTSSRLLGLRLALMWGIAGCAWDLPFIRFAGVMVMTLVLTVTSIREGMAIGERDSSRR